MTMKVPKLYKHKTGHGRVRINGQDFYTAIWGNGEDPSDACYSDYVAILHRHCAGYHDSSKVLVSQLVRAFMEHAETAYAKSGKWGGEAKTYGYLIPRLSPYRSVPVDAFGLAELSKIARAMIKAGCARSYINRSIGRVVWMFRWGANEGWVDTDPEKPSTVDRLQNWIPIRRGRPDVFEPEDREPVPDETLQAVLPELPVKIAALLVCLRNSSGRLGDMLKMRKGELDTSEPDLWGYSVGSHKTRHHTGKPKIIYLGKPCIRVLKPIMLVKPMDMDGYVFSSRPGSHYAQVSIRKAIRRGCRRAGEEVFTPHQIRHTLATIEYQKAALKAVKAATGHASDSAAMGYTHVEFLQREYARLQG